MRDLSTKLSSNPSGLSLALFERAPTPTALVDSSGHMVRYANPAFCRLLKVSSPALIGKPLKEFLPEDEQWEELLDQVRRTQQAGSHDEKINPHAKHHPVLGSYIAWPVLEDGCLVGEIIQVHDNESIDNLTVEMNEALMLGSLRQLELTEAAQNLNGQLRVEIAERTRAENALRASEDRFRILFDMGPVAIFSCDRQGVLQNCNIRTSVLWGRTPKTDENDPICQTLDLFYPDGRPLPVDQNPIMTVLNTGIPIRDMELMLERPDGSRVSIAVTAVPLRDAKGEIIGGINAFYDITERKLLESSLLARAAELALADRRKDEFLAMLAHELRNPLAPIRNAMKILQEVDKDFATRCKAVEISSRQIENMSRMIDDLLDVSRITEGKIELRKEVLLLQNVLEAAAEMARPGMEARGHVFTCEVLNGPIFLHADVTRLDQIFGNLLANACKYSNPGSLISISAERLDGENAEHPEVIVRVRDNGIGIAPDLLPTVFDLFIQNTRGSDRAHGGLGIGLTLVDRLVKLHGGSVEAHSEGLGLGSEFIVRLPVYTGVAPALQASPPSAPERLRRILVVYDNEDSAESMAMLQSSHGHQTRVAHTGPEGILIAASFLPDVVLLDIGLPGMDGLEVARHLRSMPSMCGAFLVAMTGYGSADDRAQAKAAGFDEYLVKPPDLKLFRKWLRERP